MGLKSMVKVGIAGACGRGASFKTACDDTVALKIHAVCDIKKDELHDATVRFGAEQEYTDYGEMLEVPDSRQW